MIDIAVFVIITAMAIVLSGLMLLFRNILYTVIALTGLFIANSLFFLLLGQPLLAVVQLFIMVGGISTFLFVGVASYNYSRFKFTRVGVLVIVWVVMTAVMLIPLPSMTFSSPSRAVFGSAAVTLSMGPSVALFYIMLIVMFGITLGSIILLKRMGATK